MSEADLVIEIQPNDRIGFAIINPARTELRHLSSPPLQD